MSNVLDRARSRPARPTAQASRLIGSVWARGGFAAGWAITVGLASLIVLSLIVWAADSKSTATAGGAMRFAVQLWLLGHRSPLRIPSGGALTIPPLLMTILAGLLVARGAAIMARTADSVDRSGAAVIAAAVTAPYAVIVTILAAVTPSSALRPSVGAAFVCATLVGGVSALIGAARGAGLIRESWRQLPETLRVSLEAAGAAAVVVLAAATLLTLGSLVAHAHALGSSVAAYHGGPGGFSMVLLSVLFLPNAICFAVGYIVGPGFAIGAGTSVAYGGSHLGAVPSFPLLAGVPSGPAPWQVMVLFIAAVAAAGAIAGWRICRHDRLDLLSQLRRAAAAGAAFGVGAAVLVGFAGGPAGPGRLRAVGPSPWQVGLMATAEVGVVAAVVILVATWSGPVRRLLSGHGSARAVSSS